MRFSLLALPLLLACQGPPQDCPPPAATVSLKATASAPPAAPPSSATPLQASAPAKTEPALTSPLRSGNQVNQPTSLEEINRWATAAGVRDNLFDWVAQGLATQNKSASVGLEYVGAEAPVTAIATVTLDGYLDDSIRGERFILKFSRKVCDTCPDGMSGWWLWEMDVTRRCRQGRGHEGFAKEPCL